MVCLENLDHQDQMANLVNEDLTEDLDSLDHGVNLENVEVMVHREKLVHVVKMGDQENKEKEVCKTNACFQCVGRFLVAF